MARVSERPPARNASAASGPPARRGAELARELRRRGEPRRLSGAPSCRRGELGGCQVRGPFVRHPAIETWHQLAAFGADAAMVECRAPKWPPPRSRRRGRSPRCVRPSRRPGSEEGGLAGALRSRDRHHAPIRVAGGGVQRTRSGETRARVVRPRALRMTPRKSGASGAAFLGGRRIERIERRTSNPRGPSVGRPSRQDGPLRPGRARSRA